VKEEFLKVVPVLQSVKTPLSLVASGPLLLKLHCGICWRVNKITVEALSFGQNTYNKGSWGDYWIFKVKW
jgi:hypothetical protein